MRDIGIVAVIVLAGLAVVAAAVFAGGDRSVLVPPPDAVTEAFVRELAMERYEPAQRYLSSDVQRQISPSALAASFEPLRARTGRPDQVITREVFRRGDRARVFATLEGREATASMYVDLVRERRLWKIGGWPLDLVAR